MRNVHDPPPLHPPGRAHGRAVKLPASVYRHAALIVVLALSGAASAQPVSQLSDPRIISPVNLGSEFSGFTGLGGGLVNEVPNYGVELGGFILQPRAFVEASFTSNFFRTNDNTVLTSAVDEDGNSTDTAARESVGVMATHLRPGIAIFNPEPQTLAMSLSVDTDVFLPLTGGGTADEEDAVAAQTGLGAQVKAKVIVWPKSALSLTLSDDFTRKLWTRPDPSSEANANTNTNSAGADVSFHPGGGALDVTAGYRWNLTRYDELSESDSDNHAFRLLASWRFYPLTYAYLEGTYKLHSYGRTLTGEEANLAGNYVDGTPLKAQLGLSGYVTEKIIIDLKGGYGHSMLDASRPGNTDFASFIGRLQATFRFSADQALTAGITRDFEMVQAGSTFSFIRGVVGYDQRMAEIATVHLDLGVDLRSFGEWAVGGAVSGGGEAADEETAPAELQNDPRSDTFINSGLTVDLNLTRLIGASIGYRFEADITDYAMKPSPESRPEDEVHFGYVDHRLWATLNLRY